MDSDFLRLARRVKGVEGAAGAYLTNADAESGYLKKSDAENTYLKKSGGTVTGAVATPNNAAGIRVGDDAQLADRNYAHTLFVESQTSNDRGYINFSQVGGNELGAVNGGHLTWRGNRVWDVGTIPYETGSWTPRIIGTTNWATAVTSSVDGKYFRLGNMVHIYGSIGISSKNGMTGNVAVADLPFVCGLTSAGTVGIIK